MNKAIAQELTHMNDYKIFGGTANPALTDAITEFLSVSPGQCTIRRFPDGEVYVEILESIRGDDVFIVQPTSPPVDNNLVELLALADACRRSSAARINAVIPYFGYGRSDKRHGKREAVMAGMVAGLLQSVGINHVLTLDPHAPQLEGFFHVPVDCLTAAPAFCEILSKRLPPETVVVAAHGGRMNLAMDFAHQLETSVVVLHKPKTDKADTDVVQLVGNVEDKPCLIVDDSISTGCTLHEGIEVLLAAGAKPEIYVAATHGLFLSQAQKELDHVAVKRVFVADSVPQKKSKWAKLEVISVAPIIASAIMRLVTDGSIHAMSPPVED